jgi:antitoxin component YwqK of YwqJK toxin-antitoxin module
MKRVLVFFIFLLGSISAAWGAEYTLGADAFYNDDTGIISDRGGKPITGMVKAYYSESGALALERPLKNGLAEGTGRFYYENGKLEEEYTYKNGKSEGLAKGYYESGALMWETHYKNGLEEGTGKSYYENGKLRSEGPFRNGKLEGAAKAYKLSGALLELLYKDDKLISGYCVSADGGKRTAMTSAEISNWNNGLEVKCE